MDETTTDRQADLKAHVIKYGILIAVINIIIGLLLYIVDVALMVSIWTGVTILAINLALVLYAGFQWRKENGGFLSFKSAFMATFLVLALSASIGVGFRILLFNVIDPTLPEMLTDYSMEQAQAMMERFGTPEDQMDQAMDKVRTDTAASFTTGGMLKGYLWTLVFFAVAALIIGAIIKKKKPESEF